MTTQRLCREGDGLPALKRRQVCGYHWLATQPAAVQTRAARARFLASSPALRAARPPKTSWPPGTQFCGVCRSFVPLWYSRSSRCLACASAAAHAKSIEKTFGISISEYNRIGSIQGGRCGICGATPRTARLAVDHDHKTGAVRGLLCKRCNHDLLGAAHDDVELLRRAVAYLEAPPAQSHHPGRA